VQIRDGNGILGVILPSRIVMWVIWPCISGVSVCDNEKWSLKRGVLIYGISIKCIVGGT
jgi:hypothetical protein